MAKITPETALKRAVKQYLTWKGWFVFPVLQGLGAYKGISDLIALKDGRVFFLEIKRPKGKQSENQMEFERRVKESGGHYLVIKSIEDLQL